MKRRILGIAAVTLIALSCSPQTFTDSSRNSEASVDFLNDSNLDPLLVDGTIRMRLSIPECLADTLCPASFTLVRPLDKVLVFDWATQDEAYHSEQETVGQPGVHYVPNQGTLRFPAGESTQMIYIRSLAMTSWLVA